MLLYWYYEEWGGYAVRGLGFNDIVIWRSHFVWSSVDSILRKD